MNRNTNRQIAKSLRGKVAVTIASATSAANAVATKTIAVAEAAAVKVATKTISKAKAAAEAKRAALVEQFAPLSVAKLHEALAPHGVKLPTKTRKGDLVEALATATINWKPSKA